jgi:hypothetical protein
MLSTSVTQRGMCDSISTLGGISSYLETTTTELLWGMMHSHDITNAELVRRALGLVTPKWRPQKAWHVCAVERRWTSYSKGDWPTALPRKLLQSR